jgi:hypothetical protein
MTDTTASPPTLTEPPVAYPWQPTPDDAEAGGFFPHDGLFIIGLGPSEDEPPTEYLALGHDHTWTALYQAATAYTRHNNWPDLATDPTTGQPFDASVRIPLPQRRHALLLRHPHPGHPCGCEWDGDWHITYTQGTEPGAVPVTVMRRPGAPQ